MSLSALSNSVVSLEGAPPAAVTLMKADGDRVEAVLLLDGPLGKSGTPVVLKQPSDIPGLSLREIVQGARRGDRDVPASGPGAVLVFDAGVMKDGVLTVGRLSTRVHDGHQDALQVGYLLAKPSRISVSKAGPRQSATLVDPSAAKKVASRPEFLAFADEHLGKAWPGGRFGLVMRTKGICVDVLRDEDDRSAETVQEFAVRMVDSQKVLSDGPIELIPYWVLPMGQDQMAREANLREETPAKVGRFGSHYGKVQTFFQPSLVMLSNEDEWAFKAKTGKRPRTVVGMHPLRTDFRLSFKDLPSQWITGQTLVPPKWLYRGDADIAKALAERKARAPKAVETERQQEQPARRPMGIPSLGGLGSLR